ncbi:MAG: hypothetical protein R2816_07880 [Flavobacteriaceae bacterium]|nr:hypothetical protein [Flavobacteriaceae bacterium]
MPKILSLKILFLLLISFSIQGQTKVFVDENMQEIDSISFYKKCDARVFKCLTYNTDSLIVNKVHNRFKFGKVSTEEYNQVRLLLMKKGNFIIDKKEILVIEKIDTIGGSYSSYLNHMRKYHKKDSNKNTDSTNSSSNGIKVYLNNKQVKPTPKIKSKKSYNRSYKAHMKIPAKCKKKFEKKFSTSVFTMYKHNTHENELPKTLDLINHSEIIENTFFNQIDSAHFVILKPDGEYFISSVLFKDSYLLGFFKNDNWEKHKKDLELSKNQNIKSGSGIFKPFVAVGQIPLRCF